MMTSLKTVEIVILHRTLEILLVLNREKWEFYIFEGRVSLTRHILQFEISLLLTTLNNQHYTNKEHLKPIILEMRSSGMIYCQIGTALGLHWTRVGQIIRS